MLIMMFLDPVEYKCGTCPEIFSKWSMLRKHMMTAHPHECSACKKVYSKLYNLRQHIKEKHMNGEVVICDWPGCGAELKTVRDSG